MSRAKGVKFSVIIPAYNAESTIIRCLNSIKNQSYHNYEVLIIDDGSTDNTKDIVSRWVAEWGEDQRLVLVSQKNKGVSGARNRGLVLAKGHFVIFIDSDDVINENMLSDLSALDNFGKYDTLISGIIQQTEHKKVIFHDKFRNDGDTDTFANDLVRMIRTKQILSPCGKAYSRRIIQEGKIQFVDGMNLGEDLTFNLDYFSKTKSYISAEEAGYVYYTDTQGSLSKKVKPKIFDLYERIFLRCMQFCEENKIKKSGVSAFARYYLGSIYYGLSYLDSNPKNIIFVKNIIQNIQVRKAAHLALFADIEGFIYALSVYSNSPRLTLMIVAMRKKIKAKAR